MRGDGVWEKVTGRETDRAKTQGLGGASQEAPGTWGPPYSAGTVSVRRSDTWSSRLGLSLIVRTAEALESFEQTNKQNPHYLR